MPRTRRRASLNGQELTIESVGHLLTNRSPMLGLTAPLFHQLHRTDDVCRRDERHVGLACFVLRMYQFQFFRRYAPVGILSAMDNSVLAVFLDDVLHPFFDDGIALVDSLTITVLPVKHVATERQCCCPCHIVAIVVPECRCDVRDASVCALCFADVAHPFGIEPLVIEEIAFTQRAHCPVA